MRDIRIVTTFHTNYDLYKDIFLDWYSRHFNNSSFLFFIGVKEDLESDFTSDGISFNKSIYNYGESQVIELRYKSGIVDPAGWAGIKRKLWRVKDKLSKGRTLVCDCDELIYSRDLDSCIKAGVIQTHFFEYYPDKEFSIDKEVTWVERGWYYRWSPDGRKMGHGQCKAFYFDGRDFIHMGRDNHYCKESETILTHEDYENSCFHISLVDDLMNNKKFKDPHFLNTSVKLEEDTVDKLVDHGDYLTFNLKLSDLFNI